VQIDIAMRNMTDALTRLDTVMVSETSKNVAVRTWYVVIIIIIIIIIIITLLEKIIGNDESLLRLFFRQVVRGQVNFVAKPTWSRCSRL